MWRGGGGGSRAAALAPSLLHVSASPVVPGGHRSPFGVSVWGWGWGFVVLSEVT